MAYVDICVVCVHIVMIPRTTSLSLDSGEGSV